jgi:GNAT superfamily N-acetyltransferase
VLAFEPVFTSFAKILGPHIYPLAYPDWKTLQRNLVESLCKDEKMHTYVAEIDGQAVGLIAYQFDMETLQGVIEFLVVHPEYQGAGVGTHLNEFALEKMREAGMKVAIVGTGGDDSHAPARKAYEKVGFVPLPSVWYFKNLD